MRKTVKKLVSILGGILLLTILTVSCKNWMQSDGFMENIENEVKVANADRKTVFVRYANTKMGTTTPNGDYVMKVGVEYELSAITSDDYAFVKWAAFSTNDFSTSKQHSNLYYETEEAYTQKFSSLELGSSVVKFGGIAQDGSTLSEYTTTTKVTILESRDDIFLIPIVASRPTYVTSNPENNASNVVKNMTLRILFSKKMNADSLVGNITIKQGPIAISEANSDYIDVTDNFEIPELSKTGKMVTITQKKDAAKPTKYYFSPYQKIIVEISNEVTDSDGNAMASSASFSFKTGDGIDNVAPKITELSGTVNVNNADNWADFSGDNEYIGCGTTQIPAGEISGIETAIADAGVRNDNGTLITDYTSEKILTQRTTGKVYLHVISKDYTSVAADASGDDDIGSTIAIRQVLICNPDGSAPETSHVGKTLTYTYANGSSLVYTADSVNAVSSTRTRPDEPATRLAYNDNGDGLLIEYDLDFVNALPDDVTVAPDGLYRLDVWAVDTNGNDGSAQDRISSIYITKDTTSPVVTTFGDAVGTSSSVAPYGYYNASTLTTIEFFEKTNGILKDYGAPQLASRKIKWMFSTSSTKPAATNPSWSLITPDCRKAFDSANAPSEDGPISVYMYLMDDMNNVSDGVLLSSIYYDNTNPVIGVLDWVDLTGTQVVNATSKTNLGSDDKILQIPYTEVLAGAKKIKITVTNNNTPILQNSLIYRTSLDRDPAKVITVDGEGIIDTPLISEDNPYIYVDGIEINNPDGIYTVKVELWDSALNSAASKTLDIVRDTVKPVINSIKFAGLKERVVYSNAAKTYWASKESYSAKEINPDKVSLIFNVTEASAGVNVISLNGTQSDFALSEETKLYLGDTEVAAGEYSVDIANNRIILGNYKVPVIRGTNIDFTLTEIKVKNANNEVPNRIKATLIDFVNLESAAKTKFTYSTTDDVAEIYADSYLPGITSVTLKDKAQNTVTNSNGYGYTPLSFTDSDYVNADIIINAEGNGGSGIKSLVFTSGATVDNTTKVIYGETDITSECTIANGSVTFKNFVFITRDTITVENIKLTTPVQGDNTVHIKLVDLAGWEQATTTSDSISYDTVAPQLTKLTWIAAIGTPGTTKGTLLSDQTLEINFVEAISGVKNIKVEITTPDTTVYGTPFIDTRFEVLQSIDGSAIAGTKQGDIFTFETAQTTGSLYLSKLTIDSVAQEGSYKVKVTLLDTAENTLAASVKEINLFNDSIAPVVEKIEIPGLKKTVELDVSNMPALGTNDSRSDSSYWLDSAYIGGEGNSIYAATKGKAYITINEETSGVSLISIGGTTKLQDTSKLYMVASDGTETPVDITKYEVVTETNTIKIKNSADSLKNGSGNANFVILIDNLKFSNIGGTSSSANHNTISVTVKDVALNDSLVNSTITLKGKSATTDKFWTDSKNCVMTGLFLNDSKTLSDAELNDNFNATNNYTNEDLITVTATVGSEDKNSSGIYKFVITGAKFTNDTTITYSQASSDSSLVQYLNDSGSPNKTALESTKFVIVNSNTIELRNADASEYYVFRNRTGIRFTNVKLDSSDTDGLKNVSIQSFDLAGWDNNEGKRSNSITLDTTKPEIVRAAQADGAGTGLYPFNNSTSSRVSELPSPDKFVYPHGGATEGVILNNSQLNGDGKQIYYFYVSAPATINSSEDPNHPIYGTTANPDGNVYGIALGIGSRDNIKIKNSTAATKVGYFIYKHDLSDNAATLTAEDILNGTGTSGTLFTPDDIGKDIGNAAAKTGTSASSDNYNRQWFPLFGQDSQTYSVILMDEAGNYSKADTFVIVKDVIQPSLTYDKSDYVAGGDKSLGNLMSIEIPAHAKVFRNVSRSQHVVKHNDNLSSTYEMNSNGFDYSSTWTYDYILKKDEYKIKINLGKADAGKTQLNGTSLTPDAKYAEVDVTETSSPLEMYAISHRYRQWSDSQDATTYPFIPAFPQGTVSPDGNDLYDLFGYEGEKPSVTTTQFTSEVQWRSYKAGSSYTDDGISHQVDTDGNIIITLPTQTLEACPPLTLLLKDGTGNINFMHIKPVEMEDSGCKVVSWVVDDMISTDTTYTTKDSPRHIGMIPYMISGGTKIEAYNLDGNLAGKYDWGNRTSPYQFNDDDKDHGDGNDHSKKDGQTAIGVQARDLVGRTTYYNDKAYIALFNKAESCIYSEYSIKNQVDSDGYTLRAVIRAWDETGPAPVQSDFINADSSSKTGSDFSNWIYLRDTADHSNNDYVMQYPHPDRSSKYRLYYYVEDAVGNYEINTIVNDKKDDGAEDQMIYWMYDNVGPSVLTRSGDNPATITGADINKLVASNNGYRPYYNSETGTGYVVKTRIKRGSNTLPSNLGNGVILGAVDGGEDLKWGNYFDLDITETSGIRAFTYSKSKTPPAYNSDSCTGRNSMGDSTTGIWYAGVCTYDTKTRILYNREIGSSFSNGSTYFKSPNNYEHMHSKDGEQYYDYYNSDYGIDKYSGVKVCETIPFELVKSSPTDLYLHVMDWVGNIQSVKLGSNIKWANDSTAPGSDESSSTAIYEGDHYISSYSNSTSSLQYVYAATKDSVKDASSLKVYMPANKYTDSGSGVYGWSRTNNNILSVEQPDYFEVTLEELTKIKAGQSSGNITIYVYDNTGSCTPITVNIAGDNSPITPTLFVRGIADDNSGKTTYFYDQTSGNIDYRDGSDTNPNIKTVVADADDITDVLDIKATVYTNGSKIYFLSNFGTSLPADWYKTAVQNWNGTTWETIDRTVLGNQTWQVSAEHKDDKYHSVEANYYLGSSDHVISSDKPYYRLYVRDKAGNESYANIKIISDTTAPSVTAGSIEKVNQIDDKNYYNDNSKATVQYSDTGSGIKSYTNASGTITEIENEYKTTVDGFVVNLKNLTPNLSKKIQFSAIDNLNNGAGTALNLEYNGKSDWVKDTKAPTYTPIANQSVVKPGNKTAEQSTPSANITMNDAVKTNQASIYVATTEGITNIDVNPKVNKFTFNLPAVTDDNFYGWKVQTTAMPSTDWFDVANGGAVSNISSYSFYRTGQGRTGDAEIPSEDSFVYFYPIDKAGNIGTPIILKFVKAPLPTIISITPNGIYNNRYDGNSKVDIVAKYSWANPVTDMTINSIGISDGTNYVTYNLPASVILTAKGQTTTITNVPLSGLTGSKLEFEVITDKTSSVIDAASTLSGLVYDTSVSDVTSITISPSDGNGVYFDSTSKKLYYSASSITITPTTSDNDIDYFYYGTDTNKSSSGSFTITPAAGIYKFYAVDYLGHISSTPYEITMVEDKTVSTPEVTYKWYNGSTEVTETSYVYDSGSKIYYNSNQINKIVLTPSVLSDDSGIVGYATVADSTTWSTSEIEITNTTGTISVYAKDKVGNVSAAWTITVEGDNTAPSPTTGTQDGTYTSLSGATGIKAIKAGSEYAITGGSLTSVRDNKHGKAYIAGLYTSGTEITIPVTEILGSVSWAVTGGNTVSAYSEPNSSAYSSITSITDGKITISLPDISDPLSYLFVWLKDPVGNVSKYNIGNPAKPGENWLSQYKSVEDNNFAVSVTSGVISITGLSGTYGIKKIEIESDTDDIFAGETHEYTLSGDNNDRIKFAGYTNPVFYQATMETGNKATIEMALGSDGSYEKVSYLPSGGALTIKTTSTDLIVSKITITDQNDQSKTVELTENRYNVAASRRGTKISGLGTFTSGVKGLISRNKQNSVSKAHVSSFGNESANAKETSAVKQTKKNVKATEVKELPATEIAALAKFQSVDVESALAKSFAAGTINNGAKEEKNNQGYEKSVKKNQSSNENVAPLFDNVIDNSVMNNNDTVVSYVSPVTTRQNNWILIVFVVAGVMVFALLSLLMIRRLVKADTQE